MACTLMSVSSNAAIADLADRLPRESVCFEKSAEDLVVPAGGPPRGALERPGDVIRNLDDANAWMSLLNVEVDPAISELMMSVLGQLQPGILATQGEMRNRGAFFFIASPNFRHAGPHRHRVQPFAAVQGDQDCELRALGKRCSSAA